jgi:hypothetical protein
MADYQSTYEWLTTNCDWRSNESTSNTTSYTLTWDPAYPGYAWARTSSPTATQAQLSHLVTVDPDWRGLL